MHLGFDAFIAALQPIVYLPELAAMLPEILARARAGDFTPLAAALAGFADSTEEDINTALHYSVTCAEDVPRITPERLENTFPGKEPQKLGRKELGILAYLNAHPGQVITRKALIHSVWGIHADVKSRSLDQYIVKVRDLFGGHGLNLDAFRTVHGIGYIFDPRGVSNEGRE